MKECHFEREQESQRYRADEPRHNAQASAYTRGQSGLRAATMIDQHRECPGSQHAQSETTTGDRHRDRRNEPSQSSSG